MPLDPSEQRLIDGQPVGGGGLTADSVGDTEIDNAANFNWDAKHLWRRAPSTSKNYYWEWVNTGSGNRCGWYLSDTGKMILEQGGSNLVLALDPSDTDEPSFRTAMRFGLGSIHEDWVDYGIDQDVRTEYQSGDDAYAIRDQTNGLDRLQVDRTTGDTSIEGALTEGATL